MHGLSPMNLLGFNIQEKFLKHGVLFDNFNCGNPRGLSLEKKIPSYMPSDVSARLDELKQALF